MRLKYIKRFYSSEVITVVVGVLLVGFIMYYGIHHNQTSRAATNAISLETENGTRSSGAIRTTDPTASNGEAVTFASSDVQILRVGAEENEARRDIDTEEQLTGAEKTAVMRDQAKNFDIIVISNYDDQWINYSPADIAQMKAWAREPDSINGGALQFVSYINGTHVYATNTRNPNGPCQVAEAQGYIARNTDDLLLRHPGWDSMLLDLTKPAARDSILRRIPGLISTSSTDGIWIDELGKFSWDAGGNEPVLSNGDQCTTASIPIPGEPADKRRPAGANGVYDWRTVWSPAGGQLLRDTKSQNPGKLIAFNVGSNDDADAVWAGGKGMLGMHEGWQRPAAIAVGSNKPVNVNMWLQELNELPAAAATGNSLQAYVDIENNTLTDTQKDQAHFFTLATFMLGTDGSDVFQFRAGRGVTKSSPYYARMLVGAPTGDFVTPNSKLFYRDFTSGRVLVNPSDSAQTISMSGNYKDLDNKFYQLDGSFTLAARSAQVLLRN